MSDAGHGGHGGGHGHSDAGILFAAMAARRTCKRFTPRPVELDKVLQIIQAGALAPSSGNIQNWSFIVVTDIDTIRGLYHHTLDQESFLTAMAAIVVCADVNYANTLYGMRGKRLYSVQNCAAATQNMLLAATALGLGSAWIGAFDEDKVTDMFGIPGDKHRPQAIVLLGYPDHDPEPKMLKNLDNIVFFNRFGNRVKRPHLIYFDWATEWQNLAKKFRRHVEWVRWDRKGEKDDAHDEEDAPQEGQEGAHAVKDEAPKRPSAKETKDQVKSRIKSVFDSLKKDR